MARKVTRIEIQVNEARYRYFVTHADVPGVNPVTTELELMVYGTRQDELGRGERATWHSFPLRNVITYSTIEPE